MINGPSPEPAPRPIKGMESIRQGFWNLSDRALDSAQGTGKLPTDFQSDLQKAMDALKFYIPGLDVPPDQFASTYLCRFGSAAMEDEIPNRALRAAMRGLYYAPHNSHAWYLAGKAFFEMGEVPVAVNCLRHALWIYPGHQGACMELDSLAACLAADGDGRAATDVGLEEERLPAISENETLDLDLFNMLNSAPSLLPIYKRFSQLAKIATSMTPKKRGENLPAEIVEGLSEALHDISQLEMGSRCGTRGSSYASHLVEFKVGMEDYPSALKIALLGLSLDPLDSNIWHEVAIICHELKAHATSRQIIDQILRITPAHTRSQKKLQEWFGS